MLADSEGALLMQPDAIHKWVADVRAGTNGGFQLNLWIPDPPPKRDSAAEDAVRRFLGNWGPEVSAEAGDVNPPNFEAQCEAILGAGPTVISSIMGLFPERFLARMKSKGIKLGRCSAAPKSPLNCDRRGIYIPGIGMISTISIHAPGICRWGWSLPNIFVAAS
jgi:hypothetical protein